MRLSKQTDAVVYWENLLSSDFAVLQLPLDRPRTSTTGPVALDGSLLVDNLYKRFKATCERSNVETFAWLVAAFQSLMHRYTGEEQFLIGVPTVVQENAGETGKPYEFERLFVLPAQVGAELTAADLAQRVSFAMEEARNWQQLAVEPSLTEADLLPQNGSASPVQVLFAWVPASGEASPFTAEQGVAASLLGVERYDLLVAVQETAAGLSVTFAYQADLFAETTVARMQAHFAKLIVAIGQAPEQPVQRLELLTAAERQQLLGGTSDTAVAYPQEVCLHRLFEQQTERTPERVAVVYEEQALTYQELNERANRVAHHLQKLGVGPEVLVGICVERSPEMIVGLLGILKAGGAYLPLDPSYPADRLAFTLEDSQVRVVLTQGHLLASVPLGQAKAVCLDRDWAVIAQENAENPQSAATSDSLAYVIYTSGSTGKPKGVLIPHGHVVRLFSATEAWYGFNETDVWTLFHSYAFDFSVWEIWGALLYGGKLVVVPYAVSRSPQEFYRLLVQERVTVLNQTPSSFRQLMLAEELEGASPELALRYVIFGGEALELQSLKPWYDRHGDQQPQLVNMYGITETTVHVTYRPLSLEDLRTGSGSVIGKPIPDLQVYVLDSQLQPVPYGVTGEMYVGGSGVARGYLNRPELTEERFLQHPFSEDANARLYKTGDLARLLPNGDLEYQGRIDHQVKIRGFRIELGEIEAALAQQEQVREAVVTVREDVPGDKRIVAYVVAKEGHVAAAELRSYLKKSLPAYMIPSAFVQMESMPLTPNGKVDLRALPKQDLSLQGMVREYEAPATATEATLAGIFAELLGVARVGRQDDFFELGGHSLLAAQAVMRLREAFQLEISPSDLFQAPTVQAVAERVELSRHLQEELVPQLVAGGRLELEPLSFAQQRLWFVERFWPDTPVYNLPYALQLRGELNDGALERSLQEIALRHESLRTTFVEVDGQPYQKIVTGQAVPFVSVDLSGLSEMERLIRVHGLIDEEAKRPFALTEEPLIRVLLLRVAEREHVLILNMHHIISDGWSMNVFTQELAALYESFAAGEPSPLAELPVQYADYARWQREWMQGDVLERQLGYWKQQLAGELPLLQLPTDRPRPAVPRYEGAVHTFVLPERLAAEIKALCRQEGVTLHMLLLAAFQTLLYRYTGQEDIIVGSPSANRNRREIEGLIGFFVNTLALRTDLSGAPTFRELVQRVRQTALGAYAHQDVPFEKLVEALSPDRNMSHSPLFQVMFQILPPTEFALTGIQVEAIEVHNGTSKFDLYLPIAEEAGNLVGRLEYNSEIFDASTIARMVEHFHTLLEGIVAAPETTIDALPLLGAAEREQVLVQFNDTVTEYPRHLTIPQLYEAQAIATPDAVAVVFGEQRLTYRELNSRANQVAHHLQNRGVGPDVLVGLCLERSFELIVSMLGILKAGGAYVPFDPSYPQERLQFMLEDANVQVMVTAEALAAKLPAVTDVICVDRDASVIGQESVENVPLAITPDHLAYVNFTSGSTGKPKGVAIPHRGVLRLVQETNYIEITPDQVFMQFAPISFDAATFEIWGALLNGARVVVCPPHQLTFDELGEVMDREQVTTTFLTSALFNQMVEHQLEKMTHFRHLLVGGDVVSVPHMQEAMKRLPHCQFYNGYGPTESTTFAVVYQLPTDGEFVGSLPIGRPIANTQAYVLDRRLQPVPIGVPGELCIGGDGLAREYLNRPELTAERFVTVEWESGQIVRLYKTGDLVRYLQDGNLEFLGRLDDQVKIRGFRIELGEIETALLQHPDLEHAVVVAREDQPGQKRLVAYLVAVAGGAVPSAQQLRNVVSQQLPNYMVPSSFVVLDSLPLTPTGKVDRRHLPAPDLAQDVHGEEHVRPRNEQEAKIAEVWEELLGCEVGVSDNFFELGGHSLLAMQVVNRLRTVHGVSLALKDLFAAPTVERLAAHVGELQRQQTETTTQDAQIARVVEQAHYALSHAQKRLWFFYKLDPGATVYHVPMSVKIFEKVDESAFARTWQLLVQRHESLRTVFVEVDEEPRQRVTEGRDVQVHFADLTGLAEEQQSAAMEAQTRACNELPYDLTTGPLVRVLLFKLGEEKAFLYLNMHHIITDGWSNNGLLKELLEVYRAELAGRVPSLRSLPVRYIDYVQWQEEAEARGGLAADEAYWLKTLAKPLPLLELPTDRERPKTQTFNGATRTFTLPNGLYERLQQVAKREAVSMNMLLMATYFSLMRRLAREDDIIIGMPVAGRMVEALEPIVGFFANTLAIRVRFGEDLTTCQELLHIVKEQTLTAHQHQNYPFDLLVERLNPERDMSRPPIFSTLFGQFDGMIDEVERAEWVSGVDFKTDTAKFDLSLYAGEKNEELLFNFEYNTDLYDEATIAGFSELMVQALEAFAGDLTCAVDAMELLTDADRAVYTAMNDTAVEWDYERLLGEEFVKVAEAHPERIALICDGETMTYGELHRRSNRLAHFLQAQGVVPNQLVGVEMERGFELMVALYGIIKAGGAYVPIDPEYPAQRVQYMLFDSGSKVLLSKRAYTQAVEEVTAEAGLHTVVYLDVLEKSELPSHAGVDTFAWSDLDGYAETTPSVATKASDLAYMIYTSGSTGKPKGVIIRHSAIVNRMLWHQSVFQATPEDVIIQRTTHCFDDSIIEFFWPLRHGASLLILQREEYATPERLVEHILKSNVTYMQFVPVLLSLFVNHLYELPAEERPELPLRNFIVSGEPLASRLVNQWFEMYPNGARIGNLYGATEAAVDNTAYLIDGPIDFVHVGGPFPNTEIYILNRLGQLCPIGVKGEIVYGGVQLADGYHNQPEKTAAAFIPNHLPGTPGDRLYRSGDLGRLLPNGVIECVGRVDNQVKVRGYRIELGEIEEVAAQHQDVEMASVIVKKGSDGNNMLFGFYKSARADLEQEELKAFIGVQLASYMVPTRMVRLEEMPLTPNGKVDRKALAQMAAQDNAEVARDIVPLSTPMQEALAGVWAQVLRQQEIGATDHFFELGGHSLLAIQVMNRIRKEWDVTIELKDVFLHATLEALAAHVEQLVASGQREQAVEIPHLPEQEHYELSHAQQRLYILYKFHPTSKVYNVPLLKSYRGELDVTAFANAWQLVVQRHDSLRTLFVEIDDVPRQVVRAEWEIPLAVQDVSDLPPEQQVAAIQAAMAESEAVPFDLVKGPLARPILFKRGEAAYEFYLNLHHIITDGWSEEVLYRELALAYEAVANGQQPAWAQLPVRYVEYAAWQNRELETGRWAAQEQFWLDELAKPLPVLQLPTDFPRPDVLTFDGALVQAAVPSELAARLRKLAKREEISMYLLLLTAYVMLLHHLSTDEDIVVGTMVAGRNVQMLEPMVGFFVNSLAIRTPFAGVTSLHDLLQVVKEKFLRAHEHQDYPFDLLVEKVSPERDTSRTPLFSSIFLYETHDGQTEKASGFLTSEVESLHTVAKFDLALAALERTDGLSMMFEYNTNLFKRATVERFHDLFQQVLEALVQQLDEPFGALELLTEEDRHLYQRVNDSHVPYAAEATIQELFQQQAALHPDRTALTDAYGAELTYGELHARSNQLARALQERGVAANRFVGIMMGRRAEAVVAMLAVLKAGGAYVMIDPQYPAERVQYLLADSGVQVVVTQVSLQEQLATHLQEQALAVVCIEDVATVSADDLPVCNTSSDLAYLLYTSGSTGQPKGTMVPHRGVVSLVTWMREAFAPEERASILQYASHSFDVAVWELYSALLLGGRVHVLSDLQRQSVEAFGEALQQTGATMTFLPPAIFHQFGLALPDDLSMWATMRTIFLAGEALPAETVRIWQERFGKQIEFVNAYGPTETTVYATYHRLQGTPDPAWVTVPIGRAVGNTEVYIFNGHQQLCPVNVPGELYIAGVGLANGYLNKPDKTAKVFLPHPFRQGERVYKTGDIVRLLPSGETEFLGRRDSQVKVRGYRVETGEVEERLLQHPAVHTGAVVVKKDILGANELISYYTAAEGIVLEPAEVRAHLANVLPAYMVPGQIHRLAEMPFLPSGKINRKGLVEQANFSDLQASREFVAPATPTEERVAAIWASIFRQEAIGRGDHFFDLGGHSLLAIQFLNRVRKELQVVLEMKDVFLRPVLADLAAHVDQLLGADAAVSTIGLQRLPELSHYEPSHAQKRLWFLYRLDPSNRAYDVATMVVYRGEMNVEIFTQAWQMMIRRHESLRTIFLEIDSDPRQQVLTTLSLPLEVRDVQGLEQAWQDEIIRMKIEQFDAQPFDLTTGPLFRLLLFKRGPQEHQLFLNFHHIIIDKWSLDVLFRDLSLAYDALLQAQEPKLPPLDVRYVDYATWQQQAAQTGWQAQEAFWLDELAKPLPVLELPTDFPRPDVMTYNGATVERTASVELTTRLRNLAKREDSSLYVLLFAAYVKLLQHLSGATDIIVGTPVAGRTDAQVEPLVGFFVNMLAVRARLQEAKTLRDVVSEVRSRFLNAYAHQDYSFDLLVEKVNPDRDTSRTPIYSTMFTLQAEAGAVRSDGTLQWTYIEDDLDVQTAKVDLSLYVVEVGEELSFGFEYNTDLFREESILRFAALYQEVLVAFLEKLDEPLEQVELLTEDDRALYAQLNDTVRAYDLETTLVQRFEQAVHAYPNRIALSSEYGQLTYAELKERSNQVAHLLLEQGLQPGQFVGILMERSLETVISLLGVLKAGGVYVPIDPDYPEVRIRYMIEDSGAPYLLTKRSMAPKWEALFAVDNTSGAVVTLLNVEDAGEVTDRSDVLVPRQADDLAYVIYTSGSTGQPKGTLLAHRGVLNMVEWAREQYQYGADDVFVQFASYSFDASVWETFVPLLLGGRSHLLAQAERLSVEEFARAVERTGATSAMLMTVFFKQLAAYLTQEDYAKLRTLRQIYVVGELFAGEVLRLWQRRFGTEIQITNASGPTETTVLACAYDVPGLFLEERAVVPVGGPVANFRLYVLNEDRTRCPINVTGELYIETPAIAHGYLHQPEKTATAFLPNRYQDAKTAPLHPLVYKSGDLARLLPDGALEIVGRKDSQVKVRGYRIEIGEVEAAVLRHPQVEVAAVLVQNAPDGSKALHAYYTTTGGDLKTAELKAFLGSKLPEWMVPSYLTQLQQMPLSPTGKVDRKALESGQGLAPAKAMNQPSANETVAASAKAAKSARQADGAANRLQEQILTIWAHVLEKEAADIRLDDNFFDIGGHSLLLMKVQAALQQQLHVKLPILDLLQHTTVRQLSAHLGQGEEPQRVPADEIRHASKGALSSENDSVAIIGIGLRYPGATTTYEFWRNLRDGKELVRDIPPEELPYSLDDLDPEQRERLVLREGYLDDIDLFDPGFFGISDKEAAYMDPQQRMFLLCAWEAIENAGYRVTEINEHTSVYAGASDTQYATEILGDAASDEFQTDILTNKRFVATRVAYKLNLKGESLLLDTACSTSLVAVHLACQSLLTGQSEYALAGGISVQTPQKVGYVYEPGFINSPDGHCRAFDEAGEGTVFGNGVGVVLLKRLSDAKRDGDPIYAVIRGSAFNNDGNAKVGYTAPSQQGQADVIARALRAANVDPSTISYVETHGTGTNLGDPIEVAALKQAFGPQEEHYYCALGSLKTNIGHTDSAAGVGNLIKAALCLKYGELVPSLHYSKPNPACGFEESPFYVNTELKPWTRDRGPRRAGVSAFGIGGTNAHVILEEAPQE